MNALTPAQAVTLFSLVCSVIILVLLISGTLLGAKTHDKLHRYFLLIAGVLLTECLAAVPMLFLIDTENATLNLFHEWLIFIDYVLGAVGRVTFYLYIRELISFKNKVSEKPWRVVLFLEAVHVTLVAAGYLSLIPKWLDSLNRVMVLPALTIMIGTGIALRHIKALKKREVISFVLYNIVPVAGYITEAVFVDLWMAYFAGTVALFIIYVNIQAELGSRFFEQEFELNENRTAITLSQIKPHFLINTLLNIEALCHIEGAERAEKAARDFADYLGGNLQAMTEKKPISFIKELEHTKQYLAIAQVRFGNKLRVEFDIKESDFKLPALTLQPLAENAVWHGICNRENGGTVTIRAEATPEHYRVTVADDGVGFDTNAPPADGRRHIGIDNVRRRMEIMCEGYLHINSTPGVGTEAVLIIPRGEEF